MIKPIRDHILIEVTIPDAETKTATGFILKSDTIKRQTTAKVIRTGEGRMLQDGTIVPCSVKPGDEVIFYDYAGVAVHPKNHEANKSYLIIKQNDIIAVVSEGDKGGLI